MLGLAAKVQTNFFFTTEENDTLVSDEQDKATKLGVASSRVWSR
jgi:hypothetical protein